MIYDIITKALRKKKTSVCHLTWVYGAGEFKVCLLCPLQSIIIYLQGFVITIGMAFSNKVLISNLLKFGLYVTQLKETKSLQGIQSLFQAYFTQKYSNFLPLVFCGCGEEIKSALLSSHEKTAVSLFYFENLYFGFSPLMWSFFPKDTFIVPDNIASVFRNVRS